MVKKIQLTTLSYILALIFPWHSFAHGANQVLTQFGFEDNAISTDGAIYEIWENGKGRVRPQTDFKYSGYYALEISDFAGDHDFPELQGKFSSQTSGKIKFHFAFLTTRSTETLNIALAGPGGFNLNQDGIAFWISIQNGWMMHTTDSIPSKLFPVRELVWYIFNVIYDIDKGSYDLEIAEEFGNKSNQQTSINRIVNLHNQKAAGAHPKSLVDKVSFIGDRGEDTSNVVYYVDDVIVTKGDFASPKTQPFAQSTPRKSYFLDAWYELQKNKSMECLPSFNLTDWMFDREDWQKLKVLGLTEKIKTAFLTNKLIESPPDLSKPLKEKIQSINQSFLACKELKTGSPEKALNYFDQALTLMPTNKLTRLSRVLALGKLRKWDLVDREIDALYPQWILDPRMDLALALLAKEKQDFGTSVKVLQKYDQQFVEDLKSQTVQRLWSGERSTELIQGLIKEYPNRWQEIQSRPLLAEEYYYGLLWDEQRIQAFSHASHIYDELTRAQVKSFYWQMLAGDAQFYLGKNQEALSLYKEALKITPDKYKYSLWGRLTDVYFNLGDLENEKIYRKLMVQFAK